MGNDFEVALRRTARPAVARLSQATADRHGVAGVCRVISATGEQLLPVEITEMVDDVVWVPMNPGEAGGLDVTPGSLVTVAAVTTDEGDQA